jgi:hypothetical protein
MARPDSRTLSKPADDDCGQIRLALLGRCARGARDIGTDGRVSPSAWLVAARPLEDHWRARAMSTRSL